jgi:hypothetical protein
MKRKCARREVPVLLLHPLIERFTLLLRIRKVWASEMLNTYARNNWQAFST